MKRCPRCNYTGDMLECEYFTLQGCDHDFRLYEGSYITSGGVRKYQCRKCLEVRWAE